jgi:hypothetical protein
VPVPALDELGLTGKHSRGRADIQRSMFPIQSA